MKTINRGEQISANELETMIIYPEAAHTDHARVEYAVKGFSVSDLIDIDIDELNAILLDDSVEKGYLLEDANYEFIGLVDNAEATIKVNASVDTWLKEKDLMR